MNVTVDRTRIARFAEGGFLPAGLLLAWYLLTKYHLIDPHSYPSPSDVLNGFLAVWKDGSFTENLLISIVRVCRGFLAGASFGYLLGILIGLSKTADKLISPLFNAVRQVPIPAFAPLLVLVSIGEPSRVLFIAIGACYPVALNTVEGIRCVKREYHEVSEVFRFGKLKRFLKIVLPSSFPSTLTGLRIGLSVSWLLVVAAEIFMSSGGGIGDMMWGCREMSRNDLVIVCIVTIALVGFTMNILMKMLERVFSSWRVTLKNAR
ncbi:MAG: ABC transporter permease [Chlorobiaceae bacterium]|nr:ABC transporter permease [Chlorobiaceae bacterium]